MEEFPRNCSSTRRISMNINNASCKWFYTYIFQKLTIWEVSIAAYTVATVAAKERKIIFVGLTIKLNSTEIQSQKSPKVIIDFISFSFINSPCFSLVIIMIDYECNLEQQQSDTQLISSHSQRAQDFCDS